VPYFVLIRTYVHIGANDLLQDVADGLCPDERLGIDVVMRDVFIDCGPRVRSESLDLIVRKDSFPESALWDAVSQDGLIQNSAS